MTDDYAPFPRLELESLALRYETWANRAKRGSEFQRRWAETAAMLRNAIACYDATQMLMLECRVERDQLRVIPAQALRVPWPVSPEFSK